MSYNTHMLKKTVLSLSFSAAAFASAVGVILLVNPEQKSVSILLLPIVLFWMAGLSFWRIMLSLLPISHSLERSLRVIGVSLISAFVLLLMLSGVSDVSLQESILLLSFTLLMAFYFYRNTSS